MACLYLSPALYWPTGFISIAFPLLLVINLLFIIVWAVKKKYKYTAISIVAIALCYSQLGKFFSLNFSNQQSENQISILSSNVRIFNVYQHLNDENPEASKAMIDWIKESSFDVIALHEFYNEPKNEKYETTKAISKNYHYYTVLPSTINRIGAEFGLAIFSKHKILKTSKIEFDNSKHNQACYADLEIREDTIRIINIHLESMHIEERELFDGKSDKKSMIRKLKYTFRRLKNGFKRRASQIEEIIKFIENSPYPVVLCGDLNDTPFSYTYQKLRNILHNAFEEKGLGWGSTYNGKIPFLRIDNQFYNSKLIIESFEIHSDIKYSDHYPISATYSINQSEQIHD